MCYDIINFRRREKKMKKVLSLLLSLTLIWTLVACGGASNHNKLTVTFDSLGGTNVTSLTVNKGGLIDPPEDPTKDGFIFMYWYVSDVDTEFNFDTPINENITLKAYWQQEAEPVDEEAIKAKIAEDHQALLAQFVVSDEQIYMPSRGLVHNSVVSYKSPSKYVSTSGVVLPLLKGDEPQTATVSATYKLDGVSVNYEIEVELKHHEKPVLAEERVLPFYNTTEEYDVKDSEVTLLFEEDGQVPYIKVVDFFELLEGFIDPSIDMTFEKTDTTLRIDYQYYDEEEDKTYDLDLVIDSQTNTLVTTDPGFYWAYVYSTATNFGRHIFYDRNHKDTHYKEGVDVVYDLSDYNLDVLMYEGEVVLPYYIANQLFAGSSYYNVYYNYDALYGIYSLPSAGEDAYDMIRTSTKNGETIPHDVLVHTFNFFAFAMDNFYGLKDVFEIESFYDSLFNIKDRILNTSANRVETAISEFLLKTIDEPHTSYGYPGFYNRRNYGGPSTSNIIDFGPRFISWYMDGLVATDDAIGAKWGQSSGNAWNASNPNRPLYWFLDHDKTAAVLSLDSFSTSDIVETTNWDDTVLLDILKQETHVFPTLEGGIKYFYYNESSLTEYVAEVLIKGLSKNDQLDYETSLLAAGFELSDTEFSYVKTTNDLTYYAAVSYDETYEALTLSFNIQDASTAEEPLFINDGYELILSDSAVYMEFQLELMTSLAPNLERIILDITWNTGGNVGALYRVVGFITSEPFAVSSMSGDTKSESTNYVYIDGIPTYDHLDWGLLVTPTSFSAANSLATIFQDNELGPIIGLKTGGGASSITPVLLPNGTAFTMSSNNINAYRTGLGTEEDPYQYHPNEFGIEPTHPLNMTDIYDEDTLFDILNNYYE